MLILEGEGRVDAVAFTPDGAGLVAVRGVGPLEVWTLATRERKQTAPCVTNKDFRGALSVHSSGKTAYLGGREPLTAVSLTRKEVRTLSGPDDPQYVVASPDGKWVVSSTSFVIAPSAERRVRGYRCKPGGAIQNPPAWEAKPHTAYDILGGFLNGGAQFVSLDEMLFVVRDTATGEVRSTVKYPSGYHRTITVSPDGRRVAVQGYDLVYVWDTATWGKPKRITDFQGPLESLAFHPSRPLLLGTRPGSYSVQCLDTDSAKRAAELYWNVGKLTSVAFSADGVLAAAGSSSGKIVVWDVDL